MLSSILHQYLKEKYVKVLPFLFPLLSTLYIEAISFLRFSAVIPNSLITISPGAEKPKRSTPTTFEAYLYQISDTPASIAILLVQLEGRTCSLYSADCLSNTDVHGMDTTRAPGISAAALSAC